MGLRPSLLDNIADHLIELDDGIGLDLVVGDHVVELGGKHGLLVVLTIGDDEPARRDRVGENISTRCCLGVNLKRWVEGPPCPAIFLMSSTCTRLPPATSSWL